MDIRVDAGPERVLVAADDLIWASRLRGAVERAGAVPVAGPRGADAPGPDGAAAPSAAVVDLGLQRQDATALIMTLVAAGVPVIAVGQHDDLATRKRALAAGATRVYSYDKLFRDGPGVIRAWLDGVR
jgi:DNA-binding response OmpR family regulator